MFLANKWALPVKRLVRGKHIQGLCGLPYLGHPNGCPNFNSGRLTCPMAAPYIDDLIDLVRPMWLVWGEFDLAAHARRMHELHPRWSRQQCRCVLYWQPRSKKIMKQRAAKWMALTGANYVHYMAEAAGVNMYATAALAGLKLERIRDLKICRHVALVGWRKP